MIVTTDEFRGYVQTDISDQELQDRLEALELSIRKYTNNNFQNRNVRFLCDAENNILNRSSQYLRVGDTIQISQSAYNDGVYVISSKSDSTITLNIELYDEQQILISKVDYPKDVQMGAIEIMKWKLKNEAANYGDDKEVQSETISRHSVTYAKDSSEEDIDASFGVPKKYLAFLKMYMKARF